MNTSLYVEVKRQLMCATCIITSGSGYKGENVLNSQVNTSTDSIHLIRGSNKLTWDLSAVDHTLSNEQNCSSTQTAGDPAHETIILRLATSQKNTSSDAPISFAKSQSLLVEFLKEKRHLVCDGCNTLLLDTSECERVLPLPSAGWRELADSWYCHQHNGDPHSPQLSPKSGDLLVGNYTSLTLLTMCYNISIESNNVTCQSCHRIIGQVVSPLHDVERKKVTVEMYHDRLGYRESEVDTSCLPLICVETTLTAHLLDHCQSMMTYKFILEYKSNASTCTALMIWVLETDIQLVFGDSKGAVKCLDTIKVLYTTASESTSSMAADWLKDNKVNTICMSQGACEHISRVLLESTSCLPTCISRTNTMTVGFLQTKLGKLANG